MVKMRVAVSYCSVGSEDVWECWRVYVASVGEAAWANEYVRDMGYLRILNRLLNCL